ncbi:hypothetical protein MRX96_000595 [Rhipicephalus microplus]
MKPPSEFENADPEYSGMEAHSPTSPNLLMLDTVVNGYVTDENTSLQIQPTLILINLGLGNMSQPGVAGGQAGADQEGGAQASEPPSIRPRPSGYSRHRRKWTRWWA